MDQMWRSCTDSTDARLRAVVTLAVAGASVHLYGKTEPRRGRKMGHVTRLTARGG